ncbi:suppressor of fused domain protein [Ciceribacter selenitireducens]
MRKLRLDNRQLKILNHVHSALKMQGDFEYFESRLGVDGESFVVIHGFLAIADLGTMNVLFNLPTKTSSVFLATAENSFAEVARILANVEDYQCANGRHIGFGETMGLDGTWPSLLTQEASALIFLPCSVSLDLEPLTDDFLLDGEKVKFALVVPITDDDIRIRHEQGLDALFSRWDEVGKNIMM